MSRPEIPLWEMVKPQAGIVLGVGLLLGGGFALASGIWWMFPLLLGGVALPMLGPAVLLAWRTRRAMLAFVDAVGGEPEVAFSGYRRVRLTWPERDLALEAEAYKGTTWRLRREFDGHTTRVQKRRVDAVAFETLGLTGELEPGGQPWDGDIDGPLHRGTIGGVALVGISLAGVTLIVASDLVALSVGVASAIVAAVLTVWGAIEVRSTLDEQLTAWEREGRTVGQPRLVHAGISPRWALWVGPRFVQVSGVVLGPLSTVDVDLDPSAGPGGPFPEGAPSRAQAKPEPSAGSLDG